MVSSESRQNHVDEQASPKRFCLLGGDLLLLVLTALSDILTSALSSNVAVRPN